ncbi:MAG: DUF6465 family protein [Lachnospiraceae bacterium]|nr:DUF6465 family protein [Lachnospiraceae bacterium]
MKSEIIIEFAGRQVNTSELVKSAAADFKKSTKKEAKKLDLYVQPENSTVYYVADGDSDNTRSITY